VRTMLLESLETNCLKIPKLAVSPVDDASR
jgi:hypothetical protein